MHRRHLRHVYETANTKKTAGALACAQRRNRKRKCAEIYNKLHDIFS